MANLPCTPTSGNQFHMTEDVYRRGARQIAVSQRHREKEVCSGYPSPYYCLAEASTEGGHRPPLSSQDYVPGSSLESPILHTVLPRITVLEKVDA